jgi:hypothetical protein
MGDAQKIEVTGLLCVCARTSRLGHALLMQRCGIAEALDADALARELR